ncbi:MAG: lytic transglycosylase domain-containing protein [Saccharospirillum sp.]|nr:lytic transglycosylase domain-containing protein [Saccharospirillum sp.]
MHALRIGSLSLVLLLCFSITAQAETYSQALERILSGQFQQAELSDWEGHPLQAHLSAHWAEKNLADLDPDWVQELLSSTDNAAAVWNLGPAWLTELARREQWALYLELAPKHRSDRCHELTAQQKAGQTPTTASLERLWLTSASLPNHCDPWLEQVLAQDNAEDLIWQRQLLAFSARNGGLVGYLSGLYQTETGKHRGERLNAVYQDPMALLRAPYRPGEAWQRQLALAAVDRLAYLRPQQASNLWVQILRATPTLRRQEIQERSAHLGVAMAKLALPEADYWLNLADPEQKDSEVQHWRLQVALSTEDWPQVLTLQQGLDDTIRSQEIWRYWPAYAHYRLGDSDRAEALWTSLAQQRSYYGFLAAKHLNQPPSLNRDELPVTTEAIVGLQEWPALTRSGLLFAEGDIERAQLEWNLALRGQDRDTLMAAAHLAKDWGWYHKASQAAGWSGRFGELTLRYPRPWQEAVYQNSGNNALPLPWVYAIMRQESHFMSDAVSSAGALGLMQVMPNTGRHIVTTQGLSHDLSAANALLDTTLNIELGTRYMNMMMARFLHPIYATAAYNAGPSRVDTWIQRYPTDMRIWIESIPFDETRGYVKAVMAYTQVYAALEESDWTFATWFDLPTMAQQNAE